MARYKTVLFDADGTLLDFEATERQALRRTMEARGLPFDEATLQHYLSFNVPLWAAYHRGEIAKDVLMVERFRKFGAALGIQADAQAWNREYLDRLGDCGDVLPGAVELLEKLKPYCTLALATNGEREIQRRRLEGNPITPYLDAVFISAEMGRGKPDKGYFDHIFQALNAEAATTVMVGDDLNSDIQGAINAGIDSIWYSPRGAESPLPTYRAKRMEDIANIILGER